jgi:hypothetical protein
MISKREIAAWVAVSLAVLLVSFVVQQHQHNVQKGVGPHSKLALLCYSLVIATAVPLRRSLQLPGLDSHSLKGAHTLTSSHFSRCSNCGYSRLRQRLRYAAAANRRFSHRETRFVPPGVREEKGIFPLLLPLVLQGASRGSIQRMVPLHLDRCDDRMQAFRCSCM